MERRMNKAGFSLIEMLLVIGIIAVLMGIAVVGFGGMSRRAQRTNTVELVSNAATALTMIFQESKAWPKLSKKKAKGFSVGSMCIGCGTCAKVCPKDNIRLIDGKPQFGTDCLQCLACLQYCPQEAISIGKITQKREHYHNPNVTADDLVKPVIHID